MDSDNPVVRLCVAGMKAEATGKSAEARDLFAQAWAAHKDDFDACVAAHYVARHQARPADTLHWNRTALRHADALRVDRVRDFYPSLYLCMGLSHEALGDRDAARRYFDLAAARLDDLPAGPYRELIACGIADGHERTGEAAP